LSVFYEKSSAPDYHVVLQTKLTTVVEAIYLIGVQVLFTLC